MDNRRRTLNDNTSLGRFCQLSLYKTHSDQRLPRHDQTQRVM
jgi:hypothetical protein